MPKKDIDINRLKKEFNDEKIKLNDEREKLKKQINDSKEKRIKISSEISSRKKMEKVKKDEIKLQNKSKKSLLKREGAKKRSETRYELASQKKAINEKAKEVNEFKKILRDKIKIFDAEFKNKKMISSRTRNEEIFSLTQELVEQKKKNKIKIEEIKAKAKKDVANLMLDKLNKKNGTKDDVKKFGEKIEIEKLKLKKSKLKLKNIKQEMRIREKNRLKKEKIIRLKTLRENYESKVNKNKKSRISLRFIKFKAKIEGIEELGKVEEISNKNNFNNKKKTLENKLDIKNIKSDSLERIEQIKSKDEKINSQFVDEFSTIFSKNESNDNNDYDEISAMSISLFGKKYSKKFIAVQEPSIEMDIEKFKNDIIATESINNFRKNLENGVKVKSLFGYMEILVNKRYSKDEINKFHVHMITALLSNHSIKFANGFLVPMITRKKIVVNFNEKLNDSSNLVEYINMEIGKKLNEVIINKLNSGVPILLAEGLMIVKKNGVVKVFEDSNFMKG